MALNLSRIFKGRTPAEGVVTDNVDPDELGAANADGKFGPETEAVIGLDVWEHASSVPGGTAAVNVIGLGEPAGLPGSQAVDAGTATARSMQPGTDGFVTEVEFPTAKWEGPDLDAAKIEFPNLTRSNAAVFDDTDGVEKINLGDTGTHLESENGGLDTTPEEPEFGDPVAGNAFEGTTYAGNFAIKADAETPFDEADALFGRVARQPNAQYNPKEIGIDKLEGGSQQDGLIESIDFPSYVKDGSRSALPEVDDEVLVQFSKNPDEPSGIHDIHMNQGSGYTATDDLWKFRDAGEDGATGNEAARTAGEIGSDQPGGGFLSQLNPQRPEAQGWYVPELDSDTSAMGITSHAEGKPGEAATGAEDRLGNFEIQRLSGDARTDGFTSTDDLWQFKGDPAGGSGAGDETARSLGPGSQGPGSQQFSAGQDVRMDSLYVGETEKNVAQKVIADGKLTDGEYLTPGSEADVQSLQGASLQGASMQGTGYTATDDLWKFRGDAQDGTESTNGGGLSQLEDRPPDGVKWFVPDMDSDQSGMVISEDHPGDGLRDMEIELGKESGQGASVQADDSNRPHEAMTLNFRETALGGPDTVDAFKVEIEGVAFASDGSDGGENARTAGPGAAGFRPNPAGDGTTQHFSAGQDLRIDSQFQAMPDLDASGNSVVDAADYTVWRDNLRGSTPPEGILPFIEQNNLAGGGRFTGSEDQLATLIENLREKGLIDHSTGEVLWATGDGTETQGSDEELGSLIAWLRSTQPPAAGGVSEFRFQGLPGDTDYVADGGDTARSMGPGAEGFRPNPAGDGTTEHFKSVGGLSMETEVVARDSLAELGEEQQLRSHLGPGSARLVDFREGGVNDTTHKLFDDDGPSTFLDSIGDNGGAQPHESMSLNFEEIKMVHADPSHHADLDMDVDFDGLDSDVDVP